LTAAEEEETLRRTGPPAISIVALSIVFLYLSLFILPASPRFWPGIEFINLENVRRMVAGETLYKDVFQYTLPGTELLEFPLVKIFGVKIALTSVLLILTGAAEMWIAMEMAAPLIGRWDAALAALLFLCFGFHCDLDASHHKFSILMAYAGAAVLIPRRSIPRLIAAGAMVGLAACFTQTRALVALGIGAFIVWENTHERRGVQRLWRDEMAFFAPFVSVVGLGCAYIVWKAGFSEFVRMAVKFPLLYYRSGNCNNWATSFQDYFPDLRGMIVWAAMKLFVPGTYAAFFAYWWRNTKRWTQSLPAEAVLLAFVGVSLLATIWYAPLHVLMAGMSLPAFILAIWMLDRMGMAVWRAGGWAIASAFLVLATIKTQTAHYEFLDAPAGHLAISDPDLYEEMKWVEQHTDPGETFFAADGPMLYVVFDLRNPTRVPFVEPDEYTRPRQVKSSAESIRQTKPRFVIWPFEGEHYDRPDDVLYELGQELRAHYRPVRSLRGGDVWERVDLPGTEQVRSQTPESYR
jgi:hypothetical protein